MNLCLDIGTTSAKLGLFEDRNLIFRKRLDQKIKKAIKEIIKDTNIENAIISSVRSKKIKKLKNLISDIDPLILTSDIPLPIKIEYKTPNTLGKDRIATAVAAYRLSMNRNVLVIDAGTCMTMDIITKEGKFLGGNISPGLDMRLDAMHHHTYNLPLVSRKLPDDPLGKSTVEAIQNGGIMGAIMEIEGFIHRLETEFSPLNIILTGGDAQFLAENVKKEIFVDPNLVLYGLNEILNYNVKSIA